MTTEQDKDMLYDVLIDGFDPANFEQKPRPNDEQSGIIEIRTDEVAYSLWTFERDIKTNIWSLAGIYRNGILAYLESNQFAKRYRPDETTTLLIRGDTIIEPVIPTLMRDCMKQYIESDNGPLNVKYLTATYEGRLELFNRQQHLIINPKGLELLQTHARPLQRDTDSSCFLPYQNGIVEITADSIHLHSYAMLDKTCVWKSQVLQRRFDTAMPGNGCHYARFVNNVTNEEPARLRAFRSAIGYLIHNFISPAEGQAVLCYDEKVADKPEGGTGKGLFANAIQQMRPVALLDGKKFDPNDRFCFQQVNEDTVVVWMDDPKPNFSLERFFSTLTEGWIIEKKNQTAFRIPAKEGPKLLICSNPTLSNEGSSNVRRQFIIEFSNHYQKQIRVGNEKPIQAEHGCIFFSDDWSATEWQKFDAYMVGCVQDYLRDGLQPYPLHSVNQNRLLQTAGPDFVEWVKTHGGTGLQAECDYSPGELFNEFKTRYGTEDWKQRRFTDAIKRYAKALNLTYLSTGNGHRPTFRLVPIGD